MKILLVLPAYNRIGGYDSSNLHLMPPMGLQLVASITPNDVEVKIVDENVKKIDFNEKWDLVGISSVTTTAKRAYEISETFRRNGITTIMGGIHPTVCPNEASYYCDSVFIGEAEFLWRDVIRDIRTNKLAKFYKNEKHYDLKDYPTIEKKLIDKQDYICPDTVETSRGCPYSCDFCSISNVYGKRCRYRPIEDVIKQLKENNINKVAFLDDNIVGDFERAKKLFKALEGLNIRWGGQASIDIAADDELLEMAKQSGCESLFIGVESHDQNVLIDINKAPNQKINKVKAINKIQNHGISVFASFVFGFDGEDKDVFTNSLKFINQANPLLISIAGLTPFPGTKLFDKLTNDNRMMDKYWLDEEWFGRNVSPFKLKKYDEKYLKNGLDYITKNFYSYKSIAKRLLRNKDRFVYALGMSLAFRGASQKFLKKKSFVSLLLGKFYSLYRTLKS